MTSMMQSLSRICPYCGNVINLAGSRGNGKEKEFCNRECYVRMYVLKRKIENLYEQFQLLKGRFEPVGELTKNSYEFVISAREYLGHGLTAIVINNHLQSILKNKSTPLASVFKTKIEQEKKRLAYVTQ